VRCFVPARTCAARLRSPPWNVLPFSAFECCALSRSDGGLRLRLTLFRSLPFAYHAALVDSRCSRCVLCVLFVTATAHHVARSHACVYICAGRIAFVYHFTCTPFVLLFVWHAWKTASALSFCTISFLRPPFHFVPLSRLHLAAWVVDVRFCLYHAFHYVSFVYPLYHITFHMPRLVVKSVCVYTYVRVWVGLRLVEFLFVDLVIVVLGCRGAC